MHRTFVHAVTAALLLGGATHAQLSPGEVRAETFLTQDSFTVPPGTSLRKLGRGLEGLGDIDGDGVDDLAVGAYEADSARGAVLVALMKRDGTPKDTVVIDSTSFPAGTLDPADQFGRGIAAIGDLDGNGVGDLAVGAFGDDDGGPSRGAVYVLFLEFAPSLQLASWTKLAPPAGVEGGDRFGWDLAGLDDLDGDGVAELAVSAPDDDLGGGLQGAVWVLFMTASGTPTSSTKLSTVDGGLEGTLNNVAENMGRGLGSADFDGDGRRELVIGVPAINAGSCPQAGVDSGGLFVCFLDDDGTVEQYTEISAAASADSEILPGALAEFGSSVAAIGDVDGDGVPDLAVGAPDSDVDVICPFTQVDPRGAAWILLMNADGTVKASQKIDQVSGSFAGPLPPETRFGDGIAGLGDLDGDGRVDVAVGAPVTDGSDGRVWILFLEGAATVPPFEPPVPALDGRPGRSSVVTGGEEGLIGGGTIVVPKTESKFVSVSEASTGGQDILFSPVGEGLFGTGENPTQAAYTEFDDDTVADIITSNRGDDSVSVLIGATDGTGQFTGTFLDNVDTLATLGGNGDFIGLGIGDFDDDGDPDAIAAGSTGLTLFLADTNGSGALTEHLFVPITNLTDLALGDVDEDGDLDVVTASGAVADPPTETGEITVVLNGGTGGAVGTGNLAVDNVFGAGSAHASVQLAPLDGDSDLDLLVVRHTYDGGLGGEPQAVVELYLGALDGTFAGAATVEAFADPQGIHPTFGDIADVDGDGDLDAVYTSADSIAYAPDDPLLGLDETEPPLELTVFLNQLAQGTTSPLFAPASVQGTAYSGKGVGPSLQDLFNDPDDGVFVDCVLVFTQDTQAGLDTDGGFTTNFAVLLGNGDGTFSDPSPNQFLTGDETGDGDTGSFDPSRAPGGSVDVAVPSLAGNAVEVLLTDGAGGVTGTVDVSPIDDTIPPGTGSWEGGPRAVRLADMDGSNSLDIVTYNEYVDITGASSDVLASVTLVRNDGGVPTKTQWLQLPHGGDLDLVDATLDGRPDVVVTQRRGRSPPHEIFVYAGLNGVGVGTSPSTVAAPAGHELTGGLAFADLVAGLGPDAITTSVDGAGHAHLLVFPNADIGPGSMLTAPLASPLSLDGAPVQWGGVRSLGIDDLTGDGHLDVAIGRRDGGLVIAVSQGDGTFVASEALNAAAAAIGGGAIALADVDGDGLTDIVSSNGVEADESGQAVVRTLLAEGDGTFLVEQVDALSSTTVGGAALQPLLTDIDADGTTDMVLVHGTAGTLSILKNGKNGFSVTTPGSAGSTGVVPTLAGLGYSTPGGTVTLALDAAPGGSLARLVVSGPGADALGGIWSVPTGGAFVPVVGGPLGSPGAGSLTVTGAIPDDPDLVGLEVDLVFEVSLPPEQTVVGSTGGGVGAGPTLGAGPSAATTSTTAGRAVGAGTPTPYDLHVSNTLRMEIR